MSIFNTTNVLRGKGMATPTQDAIENTFNLRRVSLEDAAKYGGSITREALGLLDLEGDRDNIIVDTKVHFLMEGMSPSIPGWHTDGVPRGDDLNPAGHGSPVLDAYDTSAITPPRYHLLVTGTHCPTRFATTETVIGNHILNCGGANHLYSNMTYYMNELYDGEFIDTEDSVMYRWGWDNIHTAQRATGRGWRYLIRVTETDHITPLTNPSEFIRTQNNVYAPNNFGW